MNRRILGRLLVSAALVGVIPLSVALDARAPQSQGWAGAPPVLPRVAIVRPLLLGFQPLAADLYWIRTIQYFGAHAEGDGEFPHLYALVDFVTSLDPHFVEAYDLGGLFLSIRRQLPQAIAIYEKGIAANPERWELPYDLGRLYFLDLPDNMAALRWWKLADGIPGRPEYISRFIARLYAKTGDLETALELWQDMYEHSGNEWVRRTARREMDRILRQMQRSAAPGAGR